jgi:HAD superfamily hydrolase (TIGR01490 family)
VLAAFFDLDKTVIAKASIVAFGRPLRAEGMIGRKLLLQAIWGHLLFKTFGADEQKMMQIREQALRITTGWDQATVSRIVAETLTDVIDPIVYDEALELIRQHQADGHKVFIVSASPEEIVAPLARYLGVDEAISTRAEIDGDGKYTGRVEFYAYGPFKADAMRAVAERDGIDLGASYAYSDSATDLPMLEAVGHPVAVNPDRELARLARGRGWEVRVFEHRVPLRDRVNLPPRRVVYGAAALSSIAAVTSAATWWWLRLRRPSPPPSRWTRSRAAVEGRTPAVLSGRRLRLPRAASGERRAR